MYPTSYYNLGVLEALEPGPPGPAPPPPSPVLLRQAVIFTGARGRRAPLALFAAAVGPLAPGASPGIERPGGAPASCSPGPCPVSPQ